MVLIIRDHMRVTTLGTSHGDATYCRFNSSTLYEIGGNLYLVDCGEPADGLLARRGIRARDLKAVFITHMHGDHAGGLDALVKAMCKYSEPNAHPKIFLPEAGAGDALSRWLNALHICAAKCTDFTVTAPGGIYDDGILRVIAIPTEHMSWSTGFIVPSYAYALYAEGKHILHTGDLRGDFSDFPTEDEHWDLCLCESTHYTPECALPLLKKAKIDRLVLHHIADRWHGETGEQTLLNAVASLPYPVSIAHDGDEYIL